MDIYKQAFELFREPVRKYEKFFAPLQSALRKGHISVPPEHWAALSIFVGVITTAATFFVAIFLGLISGLGLLSILAAIAIAPAMGITAFFLAYFYPSIMGEERKKKLENALPFGVLYLSTLARAGFPPQNMFKLMASFKEYGELSHEASKISNDVEALGLALPEAITRAINRSPSPSWTELLAGLKTTINVGGDLARYLDEKAKGFVAEYKRKLEEFSNFLTLLIEIYITLVIVGAIFFIIVSSVMSTIGAVSVPLLKAVNFIIVLIGIPVLTAAVILIAKGVSPLED